MRHLMSWKQFASHCQEVRQFSLQELFSADPCRVEELTFSAAGLHIDLSKNHINQETLKRFNTLCQEAELNQAVSNMFEGEIINQTEQRAVLHTVLRKQDNKPVYVDGVDVMLEIHETQQKMQTFVERIYSGEWTGFTGKKITDIVSIGIGGSDLGPRMVVEALQPFHQNRVKVHFVANVDGADIASVLEHLDPETTLFIVMSKSFTTQETLLNAKTARIWLLDKLKKVRAVAQHCVAVTNALDHAKQFGISKKNCFAMWDFVGGRYSLWSAIGLPIMLAVGPDNFWQLLKGAAQMDAHFQDAPVAENLPALLAMTGIVYNNVWNLRSHVIIPYSENLHSLPAYLQQADMESNGKSVNRKGIPINYNTGSVIWGGVGTNGQHAFHQLLHQGTVTVPIDFILPLRSQYHVGEHHAVLVANCLAQSQALMEGKSYDQATIECQAQGLNEVDTIRLAPHKVVAGNKPSTMIYFDNLTPKTLGALIALYEHKIFVQSIIWQINAFDQWGVELGKQLGKSILAALKGEQVLSKVDGSTRALIEAYRRRKV